MKQLEKDLGRIENVKWGPREIDLDILFYNDLVYTDENITIPHIGITERDFVLVPLREINPGMIHPTIGDTVSNINLSGSASNIIQIFPTDILTNGRKKA